MTMRKIYNYKKGDAVPAWLLSDDKGNAVDARFGCNGKLMECEDGNLLTITPKRKRECVIKITCDVDCVFFLKGVGRELLMCGSWKFARQSRCNFKNSVKTEPLPFSSPFKAEMNNA